MYAEIVSYHQVFASTQSLTYAIPLLLKDTLKVGNIVLVPFGKIELRGVVVGFRESTDLAVVKSIIECIDTPFTIDQESIHIAKQISRYYFCSLYSVLQLLLPSAMLFDQYVPSMEEYISQGDTWDDRWNLVLPRAKKQMEVLSTIEVLFIGKEVVNKEKSKYFTVKDIPHTKSQLKPLIEKKIITLRKEQLLKDPAKFIPRRGKDGFHLSSEQEVIVENMFTNKSKPHLLYGVTGAGKTEVYMRLIEKVLENDIHSQILFLVPEINLTPQTVARIKDYFGDVVVYHSRLSPQERLDQWYRVKTQQAQVVVGSRSSLFLPFQNLGAIVVDEEHDQSYKSGQTPRYDVRTAVHFMKKRWGCYLVFGSATPRYEILQACEVGKCMLHKLTTRFTDLPLPDVSIVDITQERMEPGSLLSYPLRLAVNQTLERNEQVLLFLNRRGFAPSFACMDCGEVSECRHCDLALTYHQTKRSTFLLCHSCGRFANMPSICSECKGKTLSPLGVGTQRVEEELQNLYPEVDVIRIDQDTTRGKKSHQEIYDRIQSGKKCILVGTQMVGKGLDAANLTLVGVILADYGLHMPDFRAGEYAFQQLTQVAGRAGRHKPGKVIVQTLTPESPVIKAVQAYDFDSLYQVALAERAPYFYPPYGSLLLLLFAHNNLDTCKTNSRDLATLLRSRGGSDVEVLGPAADLVMRRNNRFHFHILVKHRLSQFDLEILLQDLPRGWIVDRDPVRVV